MKCCEVTASKATSVCRHCKSTGIPVETFVLKHQLKPDKKLNLPERKYYYCKTPNCKIVYFSNNGDNFTREDVRIPIRVKEKEYKDLPVCYCFGFTEAQIIDDFQRNGTSKITEWIKQEVKVKHCACEYKNPSGHCCLGDIGEVIKKEKTV